MIRTSFGGAAGESPSLQHQRGVFPFRGHAPVRTRKPGAAMPLELTLYQVDAFAEGVFTGNPAAVVPLGSWLPDATLQAIAMENNLSETAFFVPLRPDENSETVYHLRWFTPTFEIDLCGHATLASAHVILNEMAGELGHKGQRVRFTTQSGELSVEREGNLLVMDFPAWPGKPIAVTESMTRSFGLRPLEAHAGRDLLAVFADEEAVRGLNPNLHYLLNLPYVCIIATAPGKGHDFVCRVFSPEIGLTEDPVTGSAQCILAPYWAERLGRTRLHSFQASRRGGKVRSELVGDRVRIAGSSALYMRATIFV